MLIDYFFLPNVYFKSLNSLFQTFLISSFSYLFYMNYIIILSFVNIYFSYKNTSFKYHSMLL